MKALKLSFLIIFCVCLCMKGYPLFAADDEKNGCGPSKGYELKDDKSQPLTVGSTNSSNSSSATSNASSDKK